MRQSLGGLTEYIAAGNALYHHLRYYSLVTRVYSMLFSAITQRSGLDDISYCMEASIHNQFRSQTSTLCLLGLEVNTQSFENDIFATM